jgi:hypothetical protein
MVKYTPSALRKWAEEQDIWPSVQAITIERMTQIAAIQPEYDPHPHGAHADFVENPAQRELVYQELSADMEKVVRVFFMFIIF